MGEKHILLLKYRIIFLFVPPSPFLLEKYRHEQNKELEDVKYQINSLLNRVTKIHEKEFEVLPQAWSKLHDAIATLSRFTSILKQYPNIDKMPDQVLNEFFRESFLSEYQKNALRGKTSKIEYYKECVSYHEMDQANTAIVDFHSYIQKNRIFLSSDLKAKFKIIDDIMWNSYVNMSVGVESEESTMRIKAWKEIRDNIEPIKIEIEELVQERLYFDKA